MRALDLATRSLAMTALLVVGLSAAAVLVAARLFGLTIAGGSALYFIVWWTLLFAVLPFGIRSQVEEGAVAAGTDPGAPAVPALRRKAIWTTLAAVPVFLAVSGLLPLSGL